MTARFEIVRSDAPQPWHARFRAANGRIMWSTEQYARRAGAANAIYVLDCFLGGLLSGTPDIIDVDERTQP